MTSRFLRSQPLQAVKAEKPTTAAGMMMSRGRRRKSQQEAAGTGARVSAARLSQPAARACAAKHRQRSSGRRERMKCINEKRVSYLHRDAQPDTLASVKTWGNSRGAVRAGLTLVQRYARISDCANFFLIKFIVYGLLGRV